MSDHRVAIVGAGLAGLTAAHTVLAAGAIEPEDLIVLESADDVGGRLATEIVDGARFDHGAQFFTVRTDRFRRQVDDWLADGAAVEWCRGFADVDGYPRYRGAEGMYSLAAHLADGLRAMGANVATSAPVLLRYGDDGLLVAWPEGSARAEAVILTPPIPESRALLTTAGVPLDPNAATAIDHVEFHRVIAILAVLADDPGFPPPGAHQQPDDPTFSFVADNRAKGISERPGVTFHTAHTRSIELWDADDDAVLAALGPEIERYCPSPTIRSLHIRRWRYSGPVQAVAEPFLQVASLPGPVLLAGDGFGGSKVEGAFTSGAAVGDQVARYLA
ncbi:MAG: FAD-dependent oxidoreductase [Actinomycetota bacterium]